MNDVGLLDPFELPEPVAEQTAPPARARRWAVRAIARETVHLGIRMLPSERRAVGAAARRAKAGGASSWAREVLLAAATGQDLQSLDADAVGELLRLRRDLNSGVANNLNQITRAMNEARKLGKSSDADALVAALAEARAALDQVRTDLNRLIAPRGRR